MKNILFVSMSAPPQKGAESIQVGRYLKYLANSFNIELITSNTPKHSWVREDDSISKDFSIQNRIELNIYKGRILNKIQSTYSKHTPDERFANYFKKALKKITYKPDFIYSRALPHSSTLLAKQFKEYFNIPWVMHLSDPWEDNSFDSECNKNKQIEKDCITLASIVTLTSDLAVEFYQKKYPDHNNKFILMPNVFDEEEIAKKHLKKNGQIKITHTGNFYGKRNPQIILSIINKLNKENKLQNVKFCFAGEMDEESALLFKKYDIPEVELLGGLSFKASMKLQQQSDILLIINKEAENPTDLTTLPSKLLDYCATGNTILAISPKGSSTEMLINQYGLGKCFNHNQPLEIEDYLLKLVSNFEIKTKFNKYKPPKKYEARYNAERLKKLFNQII